MLKRRTDLAVEATQLWRESAGEETKLEGVEAWDGEREGFPTTTVRILDGRGVEALGKPEGTYVTLDLAGLARREEDAFGRAAQALAADVRAAAGRDDLDPAALQGAGKGLIVTPKVFDARTADMAKVIGFGVNLALQTGLTAEDVEMLLS